MWGPIGMCGSIKILKWCEKYFSSQILPGTCPKGQKKKKKNELAGCVKAHWILMLPDYNFSEIHYCKFGVLLVTKTPKTPQGVMHLSLLTCWMSKNELSSLFLWDSEDPREREKKRKKSKMREAKDGPPNRELYALLHLSPEASDEEIRKAYRQWAQVYHPDKYQAPHVCPPIIYLLLLLFLL